MHNQGEKAPSGNILFPYNRVKVSNDTRENLMVANTPVISVGLDKYIDDAGERPMIRGTTVPIATIAYRAASGSWSLCEMTYQFTLREAEVLAALLYYTQFKDKIDAQEGEFELEFEAMD